MPQAIPVILAAAGVASEYVLVATVVVGLYEQKRAKQKAQDAYNKSLQDRIVPIRSGVADRVYVIGTVRVSGAIMHIETIGESKEDLDLVLAIANNKCSLVQWHISDDVIPANAFPGTKYANIRRKSLTGKFPGITGPTHVFTLPEPPNTQVNPVKVTFKQGSNKGTATVDSIVGANVTVSGLPVGSSDVIITYDTSKGFALFGQFKPGTDTQTVDPWSDHPSDTWTANHRLRGVCHTRNLLQWDDKVWEAGIPNISVVVTGEGRDAYPIYDPRTATTTTISTNPALVAGWWMTLPRNLGGCGIPSTWIDWPSISAAANVCDEIVTLKNLSGSGYTTGKRYECHCTLPTGDSPLVNLETILSAMAGRRAFTGGLYKIVAGAFRPATLTITDSDVIGTKPITVSTTSGDDMPPNFVTARFCDANANWNETEPKPVKNAAYITSDGGEKPLDISLPATTDGRRANYLMGVALEGSRPAMTISISLGGVGENIAIYDTAQFSLTNRSAYAGRTFECVEITDNWDGTFDTVWAEIRPQTWALDPDNFTPITPVVPGDTSYLWNPPLVAGFSVDILTPQTLPDGTSLSRVELSWDPLPTIGNTFAARVELRYRISGEDWIGIAPVPGDQTSTIITAALVDGEVYQFQARYVNGVGAASAWLDAWTQIDGTPLPAQLAVRLRASSTIFRVPSTGSALPSVINLDVIRTGLGASAIFTTNPGGITLGGSGDARTLAYAAMGSNESVQITCTITQSSIDYVDVVTILKVHDGADANSNPDPTPPPLPVGLTVTSFVQHLLIGWTLPVYTQGRGHDETRVYAAPVPAGGPQPTFASAVEVGSSAAAGFVFAANPGTTWAIWLRHQSRDGYLSPTAGGTNGLQGTTALIGNTNLGPLIVEAANLAANAVTGPKIAAAALDATKFASTIQPVGIFTGAIPTTLTLRTLFRTDDSKLYRWNGTAYVASMPSTDITGQMTDAQIAAVAAAKLTGQITGTQITDGAISTPKLAAGSVTAAQIAADTITAAQIAANAITAAELAANSVTAAAIAAGSIVAGKIAAGAVSATEIAAGAITTSKLVVTGRGAALNDDPACVDQTAWTVYGSGAGTFACNVPSSVAPGGTVLRISGPQDVYSRIFPIIPGKRYRVSGWARKVSGTGNAFLGVLMLPPGATVYGYTNSFYIPGITNALLSSTMTRFAGVFDTPLNTVGAVIYALGNYPGGSGDTDFADLRVEEVLPGELIVDGSITARKLAIVGGGGALNADPETTDITAWDNYTGTAASIATITDVQGISTVLRSQPGLEARPISRLVSFDPSKVYRVRARARSVGANGVFYLLVELRDAANQSISGAGTHWRYPVSQALSGTFTAFEGRFGGTLDPFPSNARLMGVGAILNYTGNTGYMEVTDLLIEEAVDGSLLVDGSITAAKIAANAIAVGTAAIQNGAIVNAMIANAAIDNAKILDLTVTKLTGGTLGADIDIGAGKITMNNGVYMQVQGVGFGTTNQFFEWFGPVMAVNLCSEANAITYKRLDGAAYFGGALSAGTLTTRGQTSNLADAAQIEIGPFGSNGNNIVVVWSYSAQDITNDNNPANLTAPTATIILERSVNGAAYSTIDTKSLTGSSTTFDKGAGENPRYAHTRSFSVSFTFTDNIHTTQTRAFRMRKTAFSPSTAGWNTQNMSIVATE